MLILQLKILKKLIVFTFRIIIIYVITNRIKYHDKFCTFQILRYFHLFILVLNNKIRKNNINLVKDKLKKFDYRFGKYCLIH